MLSRVDHRLYLRMRVCTLFSSSGAAELQRVAVLITQLGFPLYPVRGRGLSGRRFFDPVLNIKIGCAQV
jgi:hypothetical protein